MIVAKSRERTEPVEFEVQFLAGDLENKQLPYYFPKQFSNGLGVASHQSHPSLFLHNGTILLCGGVMKQCFQLSRGTWILHSTLNEYRTAHSAVSTQKAIFIFGGIHSRNTYEYRPKESTKLKWLKGKTEIPGGFHSGCAIAVKSEQEIWLIGGVWSEKRILQFNVNNHTFKVMPFQLIVDIRIFRRCALIPNSNKLMIMTWSYTAPIAHVVDIENESVTMTDPLMTKTNGRLWTLQMDVIKINGEDKLATYVWCCSRIHRLNNAELAELLR